MARYGPFCVYCAAVDARSVVLRILSFFFLGGRSDHTWGSVQTGCFPFNQHMAICRLRFVLRQDCSAPNSRTQVREGYSLCAEV
jgi:hypothetical protein